MRTPHMAIRPKTGWSRISSDAVFELFLLIVCVKFSGKFWNSRPWEHCGGNSIFKIDFSKLYKGNHVWEASWKKVI